MNVSVVTHRRERTYRTAPALLSRDHTATLAHASSRTERRSFDELTRTVNHDYGDAVGVGSSGDGNDRTRTSQSERARTCTNSRGHAQAQLHSPPLRFSRSEPDATPLGCITFVLLFEGCRVTTRSRATRCKPSGTKANTRYLFALVPDRERFARRPE